MTTIVHKNDIGTIFRLTITDTDDAAVDVSSATVKFIYFKKPDGTKAKKTAVFYTDGSDGIIQYVGVSGDIDQAGEWQVQGYVETSDGKFFSEIADFTVRATLYTAS